MSKIKCYDFSVKLGIVQGYQLKKTLLAYTLVIKDLGAKGVFCNLLELGKEGCSDLFTSELHLRAPVTHRAINPFSHVLAQELKRNPFKGFIKLMITSQNSTNYPYLPPISSVILGSPAFRPSSLLNP